MSDPLVSKSSYDDFDAHRRAMLATQSFTGKAILTFILYFFLWVPGLIANILFLKEANSIRDQTGVSPAGRGLLLFMLILVGAGVAMFVLLMILMANG